MNSKKITFFLYLSVLSIFLWANAQGQNREVVKASYTLNGLSDFILNNLKKQMPNPAQREPILRLIENSKVYYSLYHNTRANESIFILDSMKVDKQVQMAFYNFYTYRNARGEISGKEFFMGKDVYFRGKIDDMKWEATKDKKEFAGKICIKFVSKAYPDIYAWVSLESPIIGSGPLLFLGLPGTVVKSNEPFGSLTLNDVSYISSKDFRGIKNKTLEENKNASKKKKITPLAELLKRKDNFLKMVKSTRHGGKGG